MSLALRMISCARVASQSTVSNARFLGATCPIHQQSATLMKNLNKPPNYDHVEFPTERRKLKILERTPQPPSPGQRMPKMMKRTWEMRGPELVHNKLIHKQFGIRALQGGRIKHGHCEMMRMGINRKITEKRMFAVWRIDAPWKPITKKGVGHRMGGGKGSIDHYVVPIKADRIILELGGYLEWEEAYPLLRLIVNQLPVKAEVISQKMLEEEQVKKGYVEENNINPFSFEYCVNNNMMGCRKWLSTYDYKWFNKYR